MSLNALNQGSFTSGSQIPFFDPDNGADRRGSLADLAAAVSLLLGGSQSEIAHQFVTIVSGPATITVQPPVPGQSVLLVLTTQGGLTSTLSFVLPAASVAVQGQEVIFHAAAGGSVSGNTVTSAGGSVSGTTLSLGAGTFARYRYDATTATWYRIG